MQRRKERERERNVLCVCARSSFPRPKNVSLVFFVPRKKRERKEIRKREGFFRFKHLSVLLCAPIIRREESGVVKEAAAVGEGRKRKRRRRRRRKRRTRGKEGKEEKGGRGYLATRTSQKKKRDASLPHTFDSRRAYHATTARVQRNDAKRERERERETLLLLFGYTDEKPKDDDDFENTSKV